jgi:molecular chaperone IbpA
MTNARRISISNLGTLPHSIGFEDVINKIDSLFDIDKNIPSYPPHNVIRLNNYEFIVEFALAGFSKDEIEIEVVDSKLIVKGNKKEPETDIEYLHKGIGTRAFTKSLPIVDTVEVKSANYENGILSIELINVIPESKKPKKIYISDSIPTIKDTKQLLNEDKLNYTSNSFYETE